MSDIYVFDINKFRAKQQLNQLNGGVETNIDTKLESEKVDSKLDSDFNKLETNKLDSEIDTIKFKYNLLETEKIKIDRHFWRVLIGLE